MEQAGRFVVLATHIERQDISETGQSDYTTPSLLSKHSAPELENTPDIHAPWSTTHMFLRMRAGGDREQPSLSQPDISIILNLYLIILKSVINRRAPIRVKACYIICTVTPPDFDVLCLQDRYLN
jgi:hypothetical protein